MPGERQKKREMFCGVELEVVSVCIHFHVVFYISRSLSSLLPVLLNNRTMEATHNPRYLLGFSIPMLVSIP